jgi:hypothetical protein
MRISQRTLICFPASADSPSRPNGQDSEQSRSAKSINSVSESWKHIGQEYAKLKQSKISKVESLKASASLQGDFLVNQSVVPGSVEAQKMTVGSGRKCAELLGKRNPHSSLLRTFLASPNWGSTWCFLTWKAKATRGGYLVFRLVPSVPRLSENGCFWYSPTARDLKGQSGAGFALRKIQQNKGLTNLCDQCLILGREDLMRSPKFRLSLMGFPTDWLDINDKPLETPCHQSSVTRCCEK